MHDYITKHHIKTHPKQAQHQIKCARNMHVHMKWSYAQPLLLDGAKL
jgi:hypothetical protein